MKLSACIQTFTLFMAILIGVARGDQSKGLRGQAFRLEGDGRQLKAKENFKEVDIIYPLYHFKGKFSYDARQDRLEGWVDFIGRVFNVGLGNYKIPGIKPGEQGTQKFYPPLVPTSYCATVKLEARGVERYAILEVYDTDRVEYPPVAKKKTAMIRVH